MPNSQKGTANDEMKNEILGCLHSFQAGYKKRELSTIDTFMSTLFEQEEDIIIIGTGAEEWFFNYHEAKELIASDWEWWGDVTLNLDDAIISSSGDVAWITTSGKVKYVHDTTDDTYKRWFEELILNRYFPETIPLKTEHMKSDLLELNWLLNHMLHDWGPSKREYLSPIRFSAVIQKYNKRYIFRQIQFSFPKPFYPDMRLGHRDMDRERFDKIKEKLNEFKPKTASKHAQEIQDLLKTFQLDYLENGCNLEDFLDKYIYPSEDSRIIGTDSTIAVGLEDIKAMILSHRNNWDSISMNVNEAIISENQNVIWLGTTGMIGKVITEEEALKKQYENVMEIIKKGAPPKEKLFQIRKNISMTLKEIQKGNDYSWPFRFEAVLLKVNDTWKFHYIQFSLPFYWILEGLRDEIK